MAAYISISSSEGSPALERHGRCGLEEDLEDFFGAAANEIFGGGGNAGWDVTVALADGENADRWVEQLGPFLTHWGVPTATRVEVRISSPEEDADLAGDELE